MPAEIIPFPIRSDRKIPTHESSAQRSTDPQAEPENRARLRAALDRLHARERRQKNAVANWRQALAELRLSMQSLDKSMQRYSLRLANLHAGVEEGDEALRLEQRATGSEAAPNAPPR